MPANSTFPLWNALAGGNLVEILAGYRAEGISYQKIASRLYADYKIDVDTSTVRLWCRENVDSVQP